MVTVFGPPLVLSYSLLRTGESILPGTEITEIGAQIIGQPLCLLVNAGLVVPPILGVILNGEKFLLGEIHSKLGWHSMYGLK